jgi:hypothetical protein
MQIALSIGGAGGPWRTFRALVVTNKDVVFKGWQAAILLIPSHSRVKPQAPFLRDFDFATRENSLPTTNFPQSPFPTRPHLRK